MQDGVKQYDPIHLFIRTDEKYEEVRAEMHDVHREQSDLKNTIDRVEKRVDFGVAITGQKNADELGKQAVAVGRIEQRQDLQELKLTNLEKSLGEKLDKIDKAVGLIYKGILGIFFTVLCGGGVLYLLKIFHFS